MNPTSVAIVGASARFLAASAARAGFRVHAADMFADRDTVAVADAVAVDRFPDGLREALARFPAAPVCYTGALENHPDLVDAIAAERPLAAVGGEALRRVRSPAILAAALADAGIAFPATRVSPAGLPTDGSWLVKPLAGAGGRGIAPWTGGPAPEGGWIWQERVSGTPVSASFVIDRDGARILGTSRQLCGVAAWNARPFAWCGAVDVDPDDVPDAWRRTWERVARSLAEDFRLRGAVGVDAIADGAGRLVVLEVNPRPTASMELAERRAGGSVAARHLAAHGIAVPAASGLPPAGGTWAKGIVRARETLHVDGPFTDRVDALQGRWSAEDGAPALADLPRIGTVVPAGAPILTVFARGPGRESARRTLAERAAAIPACAPPGANPHRASAGGAAAG